MPHGTLHLKAVESDANASNLKENNLKSRFYGDTLTLGPGKLNFKGNTFRGELLRPYRVTQMLTVVVIRLASKVTRYTVPLFPEKTRNFSFVIDA